jgi:hypothetical protein
MWKNISAQNGDWLEFSPPLRNFVPVPFLPHPEFHAFFMAVVARPAGKETLMRAASRLLSMLVPRDQTNRHQHPRIPGPQTVAP